MQRMLHAACCIFLVGQVKEEERGGGPKSRPPQLLSGWSNLSVSYFEGRCGTAQNGGRAFLARCAAVYSLDAAAAAALARWLAEPGDVFGNYVLSCVSIIEQFGGF